MLECKWFCIDNIALKFIELIDTCWNVNWSAEKFVKQMALELIDTCWNVNA